jgi:hypothetical protein
MDNATIEAPPCPPLAAWKQAFLSPHKLPHTKTKQKRGVVNSPRGKRGALVSSLRNLTGFPLVGQLPPPDTRLPVSLSASTDILLSFVYCGRQDDNILLRRALSGVALLRHPSTEHEHCPFLASVAVRIRNPQPPAEIHYSTTSTAPSHRASRASAHSSHNHSSLV